MSVLVSAPDGATFDLLNPWLVDGTLPALPRLIDLAPTLFYLTGVIVPDDREGQVLWGAVAEPFRQAHPVQFKANGTTADAACPLSRPEEETITRRLGELGYPG